MPWRIATAHTYTVLLKNERQSSKIGQRSHSAERSSHHHL